MIFIKFGIFLMLLSLSCLLLRFSVCYAAAAAAKSLQSCDPIDSSPPGSSVQGISLARLLGWLTISFYRGLPHTETEPASLALGGRFFTTVPPGKSWCVC